MLLNSQIKWSLFELFLYERSEYKKENPESSGFKSLNSGEGFEDYSGNKFT